MCEISIHINTRFNIQLEQFHILQLLVLLNIPMHVG